MTKKYRFKEDAAVRYQGGKSQIGGQISRIINKGVRDEVPGRKIKDREADSLRNTEWGGHNPSADCFVSLFCGTCSVESKIRGFNRIICNDIHEYLIALLNGVKDGYELPDHISEEQYRYIREHKDDDRVLSGFVGFGCSFGGKWWGGYAKSKSGRNYAAESKKSLLRDMESLMSAEFTCMDYRDVELPEGCVVYADPPYDGTTGYGRQEFDSAAFWEYMREISKNQVVYISEQKAPEDFVSIWEKPFTRTLDVNKKNQFKVVEKLFVYKGYPLPGSGRAGYNIQP